MAKALGIWTGLIVVLAIVLWVVGLQAVGSMGPGGMGAGIALVFAVIGTGVLWLVGVVVLAVAALLGAFSKADRSDADTPPPAPPPSS